MTQNGNSLVIFSDLERNTYQSLKTEYLKSLIAPLDGMWESFIDYSSHKLIEYNQKPAGFYCVNSDACLLLFYLKGKFLKHSRKIFSFVISGEEVKSASVGTNDPSFLSLCLDYQKSISVNTYLFEDNERIEVANPEFDKYVLRLADKSEYEQVFLFTKENVETDSEEWLRNYLEEQIELRQCYVLLEGSKIIATGENRESKSQPPYSDLGVIVSRDYRRKGLAIFVLTKLKELCYMEGLKPICSTTQDNIGSIKAIEKSGFISRHRIIDVVFRKIK